MSELKQSEREIRLLSLIDELRRDNREKEDELTKIRPLARLANVISLQEGEAQRRFEETRRNERDWEDARNSYTELKIRVEDLESRMLRGLLMEPPDEENTGMGAGPVSPPPIPGGKKPP